MSEMGHKRTFSSAIGVEDVPEADSRTAAIDARAILRNCEFSPAIRAG
jgi:hypothetical protein